MSTGQDAISGDVHNDGGDSRTGIGKHIDQSSDHRGAVNVNVHPNDLTRAGLYQEIKVIRGDVYDLRSDVRVILEKLSVVNWMRAQIIILGLALVLLTFAGLLAWFGLDRDINDLRHEFESVMRSLEWFQ